MILEVTDQEVNTIIAGLAELPAKVSFELIIKVRNQGQSQLKAKDAPPTEPIKQE